MNLWNIVSYSAESIVKSYIHHMGARKLVHSPMFTCLTVSVLSLACYFPHLSSVWSLDQHLNSSHTYKDLWWPSHLSIVLKTFRLCVHIQFVVVMPVLKLNKPLTYPTPCVVLSCWVILMSCVPGSNTVKAEQASIEPIPSCIFASQWVANWEEMWLQGEMIYTMEYVHKLSICICKLGAV